MGEGEVKPSPKFSEIFTQMFPHYLNMGMTYELYWHGDASLVKAYREAKKLKLEEDDNMLHRGGAYFYDALMCVYPLFNGNIKNPKAKPYLNEPYGFGDAKKQENIEKQKMETSRAAFRAFAEKHNKSRAEECLTTP